MIRTAKVKKIFNVIVFVFILVSIVWFGSKTVQQQQRKIDYKVFPGMAMGTTVKKTIYAEETADFDVVDKMIDKEIQDLEYQISIRELESDIRLLNHNYVVGGENSLPDNLVIYIKQLRELAQETDGAFSPCLHPLIALWGIEDGFDVVPDASGIEETLPLCDYTQFEVTDQGVIFHQEDMGIDFGAVGKGIACDILKEKLQSTTVNGAVVAIGGSVLVYGDKGDGSDWHIGIQDPRDEVGKMMGIIDLDKDAMISTSGDYEKYFEVDGKRYHHIFDPSTGYPVDNGLLSVTVVSDNGLMSDALSTALFVMGLEKGMEYAELKQVGAIFVTSDKKVYTTKNMKSKFRIYGDHYKIEKMK